MTDSADIPFLADVIEARQYDELVVEHVFEAMTDEDPKYSRNWSILIPKRHGFAPPISLFPQIFNRKLLQLQSLSPNQGPLHGNCP